ncbi:unnamed protein product [Moneuplotes crassus]|uniref:Uncharacterized protein n=1 Tax=Euplotes crassus TaxID=5936 RepID=A0AAD1X9H9_EUPCR|nr:unnamed protein product [Moneuplotes crassus]
MLLPNHINGYGGHIGRNFSRSQESERRASSVINKPQQMSRRVMQDQLSQTLSPSRTKQKNCSNPYNTSCILKKGKIGNKIGSNQRCFQPGPASKALEGQYPYKNPGSNVGHPLRIADEEHHIRKQDLKELSKVWLTQQIKDNAQIRRLNKGAETEANRFERKIKQGKDLSKRARRNDYLATTHNSYDGVILPQNGARRKGLQDYWKDPATNYFKKYVFDQQKHELIDHEGGMNTLDCEDQQEEGTLMYPLCNSPTRKDYYRAVMKNHKEALLSQIKDNCEGRKQEKRYDQIQGFQETPISGIYNNDLDRMQKQFQKYLEKERSLESRIKVEDFTGDPLKSRNHSRKSEAYYTPRVQITNLNQNSSIPTQSDIILIQIISFQVLIYKTPLLISKNNPQNQISPNNPYNSQIPQNNRLLLSQSVDQAAANPVPNPRTTVKRLKPLNLQDAQAMAAREARVEQASLELPSVQSRNMNYILHFPQ